MKSIPQRLLLAWLVFVMLVLCVPGSWAKTVTLTFSTDNTNYSVSFDLSRISEGQMRELVLLSPLVTDYAGVPHPDGFWIGASTEGKVKDKGLLAVPLENCSKDDAAYTSCQANDISSPNFLHNAEINLEKARRGLAWLHHLDHPKELQAVIDYLLRGLEASVWIEEVQFRYYTTWDERVLEEPHEGIDSVRLCPDAFKKLVETASSKEQKYQIVRFDWASCMVGVASRRLGNYPTESWKAFLQTYGIKEHYMEKGPD
jgi:hypothetical protein